MAKKEPGKALITLQNITRAYGSQPVLEDISFTIHEGERVGLIGRNGSGKSTLMRIMAALDNPDGGEVAYSKNLRVKLLSQQCTLPLDLTVDAVLQDTVAHVYQLIDEFKEKSDALAHSHADSTTHKQLQEEVQHLQHTLELMDGWHVDKEIDRMATALELPPRDRKLSTLSGGELRRLDLATKLIDHPDVLLLDEPTNHIDTRSAEWIENFLEHYVGSCVLVTHDRYFLDRVVNRIIEIEFNKIYSFPGNYQRFLEYKSQVEDSIQRSEENRQRLIRRELVWYRRGAKARSTKQKARIDRLQDVQAQDGPAQHREFSFEIPRSRPLGRTILEALQISYAFEDLPPLFEKFTLVMQKKMRVGIIGPNGSGKSTLLRVLMGLVPPDKGKVIIGDSTDFIYVDQSHEDIEPERSILDYVSEGAERWEVAGRTLYVPTYLEKFLFDKSTLRMPIGNLSGGERNRLNMVKKLLQGGNFLVLDEPTNDLDLYTLRVLEDTIEAFDGCALIVSHDRFFLNRLCTHLLVFERGGGLRLVTGNYDDYLLQKERQKAEQSAQLQARTQAQRGGDTAADGKNRKKPRPKKLTYKEQVELAGMEDQILEAESAVETLQQQINDPDFYQQDADTIRETLAAYENAQSKVEALYDRWETLEAFNA